MKMSTCNRSGATTCSFTCGTVFLKCKQVRSNIVQNKCLTKKKKKPMCVPIYHTPTIAECSAARQLVCFFVCFLCAGTTHPKQNKNSFYNGKQPTAAAESPNISSRTSIKCSSSIKPSSIKHLRIAFRFDSIRFDPLIVSMKLTGKSVIKSYEILLGHHDQDRLLEDDENISVTRTNSTFRSRSSSRSRSRQADTPRDDGVLNLDTKTRKVPADEERLAYDETSARSKESEELKSRLENVYQSSVERQSRKKIKRYSPVEDVDTGSEQKTHRDNDYPNSLEAFRGAKSKKPPYKEETVIHPYDGDKDKPESLLPKNYMEQLDLLKYKCNGVEPNNFPLPFPIPHPVSEGTNRVLYPAEFLPYLLQPYPASGSESSIPMFPNHFVGYPHQRLFAVSDDCYPKEAFKVPIPHFSPKASQSKGDPFYPHRIEPSLPPNQSSVALIH
ncbi:uncharacterized protein LOC131440137 isoform X4 [Malaya genurostris]|uniref:uncharacterized protein LOC131440137 isoform X4 n=1 Tax=Malaya genurostris TaxID=325434 RepID=UPI0026F3B30E|nr:uncharacterized protein LOC131440137 isoform X4 [Malaya genurostris]XP_058467176.1 uncharacterized protein LOC131440137 isoform X4 [Malaya genurostris]XP_058467177.1 uncharacterized protein LOC131440137 isoform X4 [Malaya genurostris]